MEFTISGYTKRSFSMVTISHEGENEIVVNAGGYANAKPGAIRQDDSFELGHRTELFEEINEFIARLPADKRMELYECYARLETILDTYGEFAPSETESDTLDSLLAEVVTGIFDIVLFDELREYVVNNPKIKLPPELSDVYVTSDKITPIYMERTYRKSEYIDLVAASLGLRCMVPVWGAYLPIVGKEKGAKWKEYEGFQLLERSKFFDCPAFERLETYVRANIDEDDFELPIVFQHLSSEEIPKYLISLAAIRKLSVAPLSALTDKDHLMKIVYNYVCGKNNRMPAAFGNNIRKKTDNEGMMDDSNGSVWCVFKMKESISTGDLAIFRLYVMKYQKAAADIDPNLTPERTEMCVSQTQNLDRFDPRDEQITLCIWVMSTVIAGCVPEMFDRKTLLTTMGIAQAVLWNWGFKQLAVLLTATPIYLEEGELPTPISRLKINAKNLEMLDIIYPYKIPEGKRSELTTSTNVGVRDVEEVAVAFFKYDWEPHCCKELGRDYNRVDVTRRLEPSTDLRDELAELLIKIDQFQR